MPVYSCPTLWCWVAHSLPTKTCQARTITVNNNKLLAAYEACHHTVSASYAQCLIDVATRQGADRSSLLEAAALTSEALATPSQRLPLGKMIALFENAIEQCADPLIGLHMGQQVQARTFSALGYAAMSCATLGEAIALIPRYESLVYDGGKTTVSANHRQLTVSWDAGLPASLEYQALNEVIVAGWLSFGRWITGEQGWLSEVRFRHSAPLDCSDYDRFFGCPVHFDADDNALCGPDYFTDLPLLQHDGELNTLMARQADSLLTKIQAKQTLADRISHLLDDMLPKGKPQPSHVASALHISERTLRRRLQHEGVSFTQLLNTARFARAKHYLTETPLSLLEIALLLGFNEQSSFTSAFQNWQGCSPSQYRKDRS